MGDFLQRLLGVLTSVTWVSSKQSYRLAGPPDTYSSAAIEIERGRLVTIGEKDEEQANLDEEVEKACRARIGQVMNTLVEMYEENELK